MIQKTFYSIILLVLSSLNINAQNEIKDVKILEKRLDSLFATQMADKHIPGAAFIIVKNGKTILKKGYGFSRLGSQIQYVNPDSTIFRIGSITKTFTATALLQQVDNKTIDLNADINQYLKNVKVPSTYSKPVTAFHLLSHSAGFDEIGKGRVVYSKNELISLDSFLKNRLVRVRPAGEIPAYSTYGIALAGLVVENLTKMPLEKYFEQNIWKPLNMSMTSIEISDSLEPYKALGYEYFNGINIPQPWEWYHTFPASSINSTVTDMGKYIQMHLNLGTFNRNRILKKETALEMQKQQISVHPKVQGFGFGFYEKEWFGIKTMDHGGDMLGFTSYMVIAPEENLGIFVVHHHEGAKLKKEVIKLIMQHYGTKTVSKNIVEKSSELNEFTGTYRWLSNCITCPKNNNERTFKVTEKEDNSLSGFGRRFVQVEPLLFKSDDGERTMGFKRSSDGKIQYMSLGNINVFEKIKNE